MAERMPVVRAVFRADPARLRMVRKMVAAAAESAGCSKHAADDLVLAVNEACMNVVQHAYAWDESQEIVVDLGVEGPVLVCRVEDCAAPVDLRTIEGRALDEVRPGGLGVHFISELTDSYEFGHKEDGSGNFVELRKTIA